MILIILSEYLLSFKLINSDKSPHNGLLSEADSCTKPDNIDSDKRPRIIANVRNTNFCFDADRHCVGTTIASKNDSVLVRRAAKHHRVNKNIVINSQDFSNASTVANPEIKSVMMPTI